ncbi:MAG: formate dehydrogenase accessory sulfurtransferase FdhD [Caulobacter sp.]|nr:formate dehydrogenase accessory sulfurtransferase FdhD [Caulobacter sp.]
MKASLHPVETRPARQWRRGVSGDTAIERPLADEAPVGLLYDGCPHVVLMATPSDVEDLAVGFTLSERIAGRADITDVTIESLDEGLRVDIRLTAEGRKGRANARSRSMEGRSSCGLCGVTRLAQAVRPLSPLGDGEVVSRNAIEAAIDALETRQTLGRLTGAMHAAAFADVDGDLWLVREDVGRHNALDKLIGGAARNGFDAAAGFAVITSRCSYEMVEKAAVAGFPLMVAISAPTALAIRKAEECGMTLVALARADGCTVFTRPERIAP